MAFNQVDQLRDIVATLPQITDPQIHHLTQDLEKCPMDLTARAKLIGYFYYVAQSNKWEEHFMWLVENMPDHPFLARTGDLVMDELHPEFYELLKEAWKEKIALHPAILLDYF